MTLAEWVEVYSMSELYSISVVYTHYCTVTIQRLTQYPHGDTTMWEGMIWALYHLTDYAVSSVSGPTRFMVKRMQPIPRATGKEGRRVG